MNSVVPEGWENRQFGQFCREKSVKFDGKSEIPVLSVTKYDGFVSSLDYFNKQVFSRDLSSYKVVRKGQFAYATIHLDEGSLGLLSDYDGGLISPMYTVFETTQECDSKFLFFLMKSDLYMTKYPALGQGSINRRMSISFRSLSELNIATPPLPEQKKIASILTSVDEVIENTQKQIDKLQDLKKAIMNELLTKGVGHTEFKDSELGRIPKSWKEVSLGKLIDKLIDFRGRTPKKLGLDWGGGKIKALSANNVKMGRVDFEKECYLASNELYEKWMTKGDSRKDDVLFTMEAPLGNVCLVPDNNRYILSQRVILFRVNKLILPSYIHHTLASQYFQNTLDKHSTGTTATGIQQKNLVKLKLLVPSSIEEQQKIASIITSVDKKIEYIQKKLSQTQSLKKSLMQDLLTGKVRVTLN